MDSVAGMIYSKNCALCKLTLFCGMGKNQIVKMKAMSYFNRQGRNKENLRAPYNMLGSRQNERTKKKRYSQNDYGMATVQMWQMIEKDVIESMIQITNARIRNKEV